MVQAQTNSLRYKKPLVTAHGVCLLLLTEFTLHCKFVDEVSLWSIFES